MNLVSLMVIVSALFAGTHQEPQTFAKKLTYQPIKNQPVEISSFTAEGQKIDPNASFQSIGANVEWIKTLSFDVKNTSSQPIQYITVSLLLRYSDPASTPVFWSLMKGETIGPENTVIGSKIDFFPEESIKFEVSDTTYVSLLEFLSRDGKKIEDISTVSLHVTSVEFPDHTLWDRGVMYTRDPQDATHWIPIPRKTY
jgi:hypothetical protein